MNILTDYCQCGHHEGSHDDEKCHAYQCQCSKFISISDALAAARAAALTEAEQVCKLHEKAEAYKFEHEKADVWHDAAAAIAALRDAPRTEQP